MPRPELAPLITIDEQELDDLHAAASGIIAEPTDQVFALNEATDAAQLIQRLTAELDAQRRAHATAYAEARRAALEEAIRVVRDRAALFVGKQSTPALALVLYRLEALRDAAPPACGAD
jgi:hypothetical protein